MLRGNCPAKIDAKGRLKIPQAFRRFLEEKYGREFFVTSISGESARIYPMPVWLEVEQKLQASPSLDPAIVRFRNLVNYYGQPASCDEQGRILIHPLLRVKSGLDGAVAVLGNMNCLDVWSRERFEAKLQNEPLQDEHWKMLAGLGL
jgi:MraZ protein